MFCTAYDDLCIYTCNSEKEKLLLKEVIEKQAYDINMFFVLENIFVKACVSTHLILSTCCVADTTSPASSLGDPWLCVSRSGESERVVTPPPGPVSVPCISLESPTPASPQPEVGDCDGDYDDGPEYLAIGNLGQRSRRDSRSSTQSSEQSKTQDQSLQRSSLLPPPPRRSSFSEGQRGLGRGPRGHTRSFSDTGVNQKLRNGK